MDSRKILNSDQIGLSHYTKMEEDTASQNQLSNSSSLAQEQRPETRGCMWPHKWMLYECCCGCSLRTGSLFIGWCLMLSSSFLLLGSVLAPVPDLFRWEDLIFTSLKFIASIILLIGVYKHRVKVVRAAVILSLIDTLAEIILAVVFSVQMGHPLPVLVLVFILPLSIYLLVVVNSYANQMESGLVSNEMPPVIPGMNV